MVGRRGPSTTQQHGSSERADANSVPLVNVAPVEDDGRFGDGDDDAEPWSDSSDPFAGWTGDFDDFDDAPTAPYPLPPDDRLWRHPSELAHLSPTGAAPGGGPLRTLLAVGLAAGLIGAAITAVAFTYLVPRAEHTVERVVERQAVQPAVRPAAIGLTGFSVADIAEAVTPSVVRVEVYVGRQTVGSGSGVIFRDDGHVITNAHVVENGDRIRVAMYDGELLDALLVGMDPVTDIAVVQITEPVDSPFVPAVLGSTAELRTGETAIAIGSPLRLLGGPTVTVGVISAVDRRLQSPGGDWLYDLVQTDAPISPGSSGGALVDANGALVGITTVIAVSDVGAEGLGFATPVEIAYEVATDIMTWGAARHGLLGLRGEDAEDDELAATGRPTGVIVREVDPTGPAGQAGVQVGDIILSLDSEPVDGMSDLVVDARFLDPGSNATLELYRDGEYLAVTVVVGELR
jgi:putative serine protease PepD